MPQSNLLKPFRWFLATLAFIVVALLASTASAQTLHTLHTFGMPAGGKFPSGRLLADAAGNLYGVTYLGGSFGRGTIFELSPPSSTGNWTEPCSTTLPTLPTTRAPGLI